MPETVAMTDSGHSTSVSKTPNTSIAYRREPSGSYIKLRSNWLHDPTKQMDLKVEKEYENGVFGDQRLSKRLVKMGTHLAKKPSISFPRSMRTVSDLEGTYRFLGHPEVSPDKILAPHIEATSLRCDQRLCGISANCLASAAAPSACAIRVRCASESRLTITTN